MAQLWAAKRLVPVAVMPDLLLAVAELVTNALCHGQPPIELELTTDGAKVRGMIRDGSVAYPEFHRGANDGSGLGLVIVEACTSRWGTESREDGKVVWFEIDYSNSANRWTAHATFN
jgi:two-component sensor histidine kinase